MTAFGGTTTMRTMAGHRVRTLVLQEFRLSAADADGAVARIVDAATHGLEPAVPLLTSIDDHRDVATIRGLREGEMDEPPASQRAALEAFVSSWPSPRYYVSRIAERSRSLPTHYRLAVTESGPQNEQDQHALAQDDRTDANGTWSPLDLLWVGGPAGARSGVLVLVGNHDDAGAERPDPRTWPLPLSRQLGVRIYESAR
jgi:hypothetical protein